MDKDFDLEQELKPFSQGKTCQIKMTFLFLSSNRAPKLRRSCIEAFITTAKGRNNLIHIT